MAPARHVFGRPCVSDAQLVYSEELVRNLVRMGEEGRAAPPLHSPAQDLPGTQLRVHVGAVVDASFGEGVRPSPEALHRLSMVAVNSAVARVVAGPTAVLLLAAAPQRGPGAPDVLITFDKGGGAAAEAARTALTAGDTLRVDVGGRSHDVRWSREAPRQRFSRQVIVKLHDVPIELCFVGSGAEILACMGIERESVTEEWCGGLSGCAGMRDASVRILRVRTRGDDPNMFGLADAVYLGEGVRPVRVHVRRPDTTARDCALWRLQVRQGWARGTPSAACLVGSWADGGRVALLLDPTRWCLSGTGVLASTPRQRTAALVQRDAASRAREAPHGSAAGFTPGVPMREKRKSFAVFEKSAHRRSPPFSML